MVIKFPEAAKLCRCRPPGPGLRGAAHSFQAGKVHEKLKSDLKICSISQSSSLATPERQAFIQDNAAFKGLKYNALDRSPSIISFSMK